MNPEDIEAVVGKEWVISENIVSYLSDETPEGVMPRPSNEVIVVKPANAEEIAEIMKIAYRERVPVYPRGGGTGLVGGAIPTKKGIVLSLERMKEIEIDEENLMCTVEPGITRAELEEILDKRGLFFPARPGNEDAFVGGLIANNAGGARAIRHGVMRNYVKGLEVVLADGSVLNMGGKLLKNNTGYDLMDLFVGSEGTLGIITKAILRVYPKPKHSVTLIVPFEDRHSALAATPVMLEEGLLPYALEYTDRDAAEISAKDLGMSWPCTRGRTQLIILVAEDIEDLVYEECEKIGEIAERFGALEPMIAERKEEQDAIWKIRNNTLAALKHDSIYTIDPAVPPARIAMLIDELDRIAAKYGTRIPLYGHAGDGNLHGHIMKDLEPSKLPEMRREIYEKTIELGGTITAEHGIGKVRREFITMALDEKYIELSRAIKSLFDPENILNPDCKI